jgi:hypothetical protein
MTLSFLIDSGSSSCFLYQQAATRLQGITTCQSSMQVLVDGGSVLQSFELIPALQWTSGGHTFCD